MSRKIVAIDHLNSSIEYLYEPQIFYLRAIESLSFHMHGPEGRALKAAPPSKRPCTASFLSCGCATSSKDGRARIKIDIRFLQDVL